jgi:hypothetical protein
MPSFLKKLCAGKEYLWYTRAPKGRSGGILVGVDLQVLDIGAIYERDFFVKFRLCNKSDSLKRALVALYGPAQDDQKEKFLAEMVNMCSHGNLPIMIGGAFNFMRSSEEKNNDRFNSWWPFHFNAIIDGLNLRELEMSGRKYTWANNLLSPLLKNWIMC